MGERIKLVVGCPYPNHGTVSPETKASVEALVASNEFDVRPVFIKGSSISISRNICVNNGQSQLRKQTGFWGDYYLMLDADIQFTVENVKQLIADDKDIVSGAYNDRSMPSKIVAGGYDEFGIARRETTFLDASERGLQKVRFVGGGFLLVKREVFETLEFPWFRETIVQYGESACYVGEDIGFCLHAEQAGYAIWCDCDCRVVHLINFNTFGGFMDVAEIEKIVKDLTIQRSQMETAIHQKIQHVQQLETDIYNGKLQLSELIGKLQMAQLFSSKN